MDRGLFMNRFPVFLARSIHRGQASNVVAVAERRLIRQNPDDPVIAVVEAPRGSRVRTKPDQNGPDQLVVPLSRSLFGRFFGGRVAIPAKYLIGDAYRGAYGLILAEDRTEALR
jgi:hypothetical protein